MPRYLVPSDSTDTDYVVTVSHSGYSCTCIGYKYNRHCKHGDRVLASPKQYTRTDNYLDILSRRKPGVLVIRRKIEKVIGPEFLKPMLAMKIELDDLDWVTKTWAVEEKFDGHRLIVCVQDGMVIAWARSGKRRTLPAHLMKALTKFPNGTYDGELCIPHGRSYNVTETTRALERVYVVFDVLRLLGKHTTMLPYSARRECLVPIFKKLKPKGVELAESTIVHSAKAARKVLNEIWERDGEGIILKHIGAQYEHRRSASFIKEKKLRSAVLTCIGFKAGKLGPCARAVLEDKDGNQTKVKIRNLKWLAEVTRSPKKFIGKQMRIDYQERTPDGSYRHPRMDRWEDR